MEPLIELPVEKWPILMDKLKGLWPINVAGFYALHLNLHNPGVRNGFHFKVYCPYGEMDNGFVSTNIKPEGSQDCIIFSTSKYTSKLKDALATTKLIDWSQKVCVDMVSSLILNCLHKLHSTIRFKKFQISMVKTYYLDHNTRSFSDLRSPANTTISPVRPEHLAYIDHVWPYRFDGSLGYFSILTSNGLSYGLYLNEKLIAWVFINEYNVICHLYCEEEYRGRGFGDYLTKTVINQELGQGNDVYANVIEGNDKAEKLFQKLGFIFIDDGAYVYVEK